MHFSAKQPAGWGKAAPGSHPGVSAGGKAWVCSQGAVGWRTGESPRCSAAPSSWVNEDANRLWFPGQPTLGPHPHTLCLLDAGCIPVLAWAVLLACYGQTCVLTLWLDLQLLHHYALAWGSGLWLMLAVATGHGQLLPKYWRTVSIAGGCCLAVTLGPACWTLAKQEALSPPWLCHPHWGCSLVHLVFKSCGKKRGIIKVVFQMQSSS